MSHKFKFAKLGCVKVKVLWKVCKFNVAKRELRRLTVAEVRCGFLFSDDRKGRE